MANWGPERAEVIRVLQEQIRKARIRLDALAATADAEETSFHLRDEADIAHAELREETDRMQEAFDKLGQGSYEDDIRLMQQILEDLRRDTEQ